MKVSFISTVINEERTIIDFLKSIFQQSTVPDEIIIVDGGSLDKTLSRISNFQFPISNKKIRFKFLVKKGNRAVGRNEAIGKASNEIIACSDAGCILDKNWLKNIVKPFNDPKVDLVAGYYKGFPKSIFEKCLIPYVLVMPDRVIGNSFLPASRSMAFKKSIWKKAGRFPEEYSNNEDYVFARNLKKICANMIFEKGAIVYWKPRNNIKDAFIMFYRFAKGDSESQIFRPKVFLIFLRYIIGVTFFFSFLVFGSYIILNVVWSIAKNYRYVKDWRALFYLPLIQFVADIAVIIGTTIGIYRFFFYSRNKT